MTTVPAEVWDVLICPSCGSDVETLEAGAFCQYCEIQYSFYGDTGQLDMRLQRRKKHTLKYHLPDASAIDQFNYDLYKTANTPQLMLAYDDLPAAWRDGNRMTAPLLSFVPKAEREGALMLDLSCGDGSAEAVFKDTGYVYIGMDFESMNAPVLGDIHALPLRDASIDFVLAVGALERAQHPEVVIREIARVLKPGGTLIGTCAFLEPFKHDSYHHFSILGVWSLLRFGGFKVEHLAPNSRWSGLYALVAMGLLPQAPRWIVRAFTLPLEAAHWLWWQVGYRLNPLRPNLAWHKYLRQHQIAGGFGFACVKPADAPKPVRMPLPRRADRWHVEVSGRMGSEP